MGLNVVVVGAGYVGLVSGACFADFGHNVVCVDSNEAKISDLTSGHIPIFEPALEDVVKQNTSEHRLRFSTDLASSVKAAEIILIAVGTPTRTEDGYADLKHVFAAAKEIAKSITTYKVIIIKSTVPVGTGDEVEALIRHENPSVLFDVVSNPEFLREGIAVQDFMVPDRIIVGSNSERAISFIKLLYSPVDGSKSPILFMSRRSAELTKYAANAFLATKITFINEIADLCERAGADVSDIALGMGMDDRIGRKFLQAGPGYGGSCFPKDTLALLKSSEDFGALQRIVETVVSVNEQRKRNMARKIIAALDNNVRGKKVAVLGLTFKPNTDDMRKSPAIVIIQRLQGAGAIVSATDPEGMERAKEVLEDVDYHENPYAAADGAHALAIVTEWSQFAKLDYERLAKLMVKGVILDFRNICIPSDVRAAGLTYIGLGK